MSVDSLEEHSRRLARRDKLLWIKERIISVVFGAATVSLLAMSYGMI